MYPVNLGLRFQFAKVWRYNKPQMYKIKKGYIFIIGATRPWCFLKGGIELILDYYLVVQASKVDAL